MVWVKICGITSEEDALLAVAMGADALGFIFAPSPRQMRSQDVADIVKRLPPEIMTVGVFKDESPERVVHIVRSTGLKAAQIHGNFTANDARTIRKSIFHTFVSFSAGDDRVARVDEYEPYAVLLDSPQPGSGKVFDWALIDALPDGHKLIVAGGLTSDNVVDAIRIVNPWGVDVSTGVESAPGRKDPVKLRAFIAKAHVASREVNPDGERDDDRPPVVKGQGDVYDWQEDGM
jgi:phosphoribosylanthranilate isomerase